MSHCFQEKKFAWRRYILSGNPFAHVHVYLLSVLPKILSMYNMGHYFPIIKYQFSCSFSKLLFSLMLSIFVQ